MSLVASDPTGTIMADVVPGASIVPKGSAFRYKSPSGGATQGIKTITVREKRNSGGIFKLTLRTANAWTEGAATSPAGSTDVRVNVGGHCFRGSATKVK